MVLVLRVSVFTKLVCVCSLLVMISVMVEFEWLRCWWVLVSVGMVGIEMWSRNRVGAVFVLLS